MNQPNVRIQGEGVVAVIEEQGRYLLIRRARELRAGGMWCFVGGRIEPNESQEGALIREVREEVGLHVQPLRKVWQCLSLNREWILHCWLARRVAGQIVPNPREVAACDWLAPEEIARLPDVMPSVIEYFVHMGTLSPSHATQ